jgi:hypothetical protein
MAEAVEEQEVKLGNWRIAGCLGGMSETECKDGVAVENINLIDVYLTRSNTKLQYIWVYNR